MSKKSKTVRESTRYAFVASETQLRKRKYISSPDGAIVIDTSLGFLIKQLIEKPDNKGEDNSFNFNYGVLTKKAGSKTGLIKRFEHYRFSPKELMDVEEIFVNGVVPKGKVMQLLYSFMKILKKYDKKANFKNWKKSKGLEKALKKASKQTILVTGIYQDARDDLEVLEDETKASLFLRYVSLGLDYNPLLQSFSYDEPVEKTIEIDGEEKEISVSEVDRGAIVTRTSLRYLRDFSTAKKAGNRQNLYWQALKKRNDDGSEAGFWSSVIHEVPVEDLNEYYLAQFPDDVRDELIDADILRITYTFNDKDKIKERVLETDENAILVFIGYIEADLSKKSKCDVYTNDDGVKAVTLKATRGTFYVLQNLESDN